MRVREEPPRILSHGYLSLGWLPGEFRSPSGDSEDDGRLPGEYVQVCSEEGDERLFLFEVPSWEALLSSSTSFVWSDGFGVILGLECLTCMVGGLVSLVGNSSTSSRH